MQTAESMARIQNAWGLVTMKRSCCRRAFPDKISPNAAWIVISTTILAAATINAIGITAVTR
jgi:hypothetical protein